MKRRIVMRLSGGGPGDGAMVGMDVSDETEIPNWVEYEEGRYAKTLPGLKAGRYHDYTYDKGATCLSDT